MPIFDFCPDPSDWQVHWSAIDAEFPWVRKLRGCPQNPRYHGEGDVWIHTKMVCEAMAGLDGWRALEPELREDLFAAALLHDSAKPECTKVQKDGRVTSRGHARRGSLLARRLLWREGVEPDRRERICALVRQHMVPLYLRDSGNQQRQVLTLSHTLRCDQLHLLGRADALGRVCDDPEDLEARHEAYEAICRAWDCFEGPYEFASDHGRFRYLRHESEDPGESCEATGPEVILLCGLPSDGKRRWLETGVGDHAVISVDQVRAELGSGWSDNQGTVVALARERARALLQEGRSLVWWDMNLSRQLRDHLMELFAEYDAAIRIVHVEARPEQVREHLGRLGMAETDLGFLLERWEVPDPTEGHELEWVAAEAPDSPLVVGLDGL